MFSLTVLTHRSPFSVFRFPLSVFRFKSELDSALAYSQIYSHSLIKLRKSVFRFPLSVFRFPFSVLRFKSELDSALAYSQFSVLRFPFSVLRFPFSVLLGPSTNKSMAPAISIIIPVADNHCHGSFTISITAYLSP